MNDLTRTETNQIKQAEFISNGEIIDRYINSLDVRQRSKDTYRKGVIYFMQYLAQNNITTPKRSDVLNYKDELNSKYTASTSSTYLTAVRNFFTWINAETGYPNIAAGIKNPKGNRNGHLKDALSVEQARTVLKTIKRDTLKDKRDYAIIQLLTLTGLRTIEVTRADIEDIRQIDGLKVLYVQGKGRDQKDEYVKLTGLVETALNEYLEARKETEKLNGSKPLFVSNSKRNNGERITTRSVSRIAKQSLINAGLNSDRLTAHSFRHTAVTLALKGGASIRDVQQMARHANPLTTERYAHDLKRLTNSAEDMAEQFLMAM